MAAVKYRIGQVRWGVLTTMLMNIKYFGTLRFVEIKLLLRAAFILGCNILFVLLDPGDGGATTPSKS